MDRAAGERERGARGTARAQRALRGVAAAAVSTVVAATAHTLAGGGAPPWWLVLTVVALAAPAAVWLVGRRPSLRGTATAVIVAQVGLHAAFAAVGTAAPATTAAHPSQHGHSLPALAASSSAALAPHLHLDPGMIAAHLLAAALTVLLLVRGEALVRAIARGIRRLLTRARAIRPVPAARREAAAPPVARVRRPVFLSALSRRGPPAFAR